MACVNAEGSLPQLVQRVLPELVVKAMDCLYHEYTEVNIYIYIFSFYINFQIFKLTENEPMVVGFVYCAELYISCRDQVKQRWASAGVSSPVGDNETAAESRVLDIRRRAAVLVTFASLIKNIPVDVGSTLAHMEVMMM